MAVNAGRRGTRIGRASTRRTVSPMNAGGLKPTLWLQSAGKHRSTVIPAKAGIHFCSGEKSKWVPDFAGMT
jgi:hypothetical protein